MDRAKLEALPKEELIDVILELYRDDRLREEDVAGTEAALATETSEADKYARFSAEADAVIHWMVSELVKRGVRIPADETQTDKINAAIDRHVERLIKQQAEAARKAARAAEGK